MGTTVTDCNSPSEASRVRMIAGRRLSGGPKAQRRISPHFMQGASPCVDRAPPRHGVGVFADRRGAPALPISNLHSLHLQANRLANELGPSAASPLQQLVYFAECGFIDMDLYGSH